MTPTPLESLGGFAAGIFTPTQDDLLREQAQRLYTDQLAAQRTSEGRNVVARKVAARIVSSNSRCFSPLEVAIAQQSLAGG